MLLWFPLFLVKTFASSTGSHESSGPSSVMIKILKIKLSCIKIKCLYVKQTCAQYVLRIKDGALEAPDICLILSLLRPTVPVQNT